MDGNTRLCTATAATSLKETFGSDGQPGSFTDIEYADTFFHVGHNPAENQTVTRGRPCDYSGMSYARLRGAGGIQWPCTEEHPEGTERLYTDGVFHTQTEYTQSYGHDLNTGGANTETEHRALGTAGRAILHPAIYFPPHEPPSEVYPFVYLTGRNLYHFHTRTKAGRAPQLVDAAPDAWAEMAAVDADRLGIGEGDVVRIESRRGRIEVPVRISGIREGTVFVPFHFGYFDTAGGGHPDGRARAANELTIVEWDPTSKQPNFKVAAVRITRIADATGPAPAPTTTASAPVRFGVPPTQGSGFADVSSRLESL